MMVMFLLQQLQRKRACASKSSISSTPLFFQHLQNVAAFKSAVLLAAKQNTTFLAEDHHRATKSKAGPFVTLPPPPLLPLEGK